MGIGATVQEISHVRPLQAWDLGFIELSVLDSICGSQNLGFGAVFGLGHITKILCNHYAFARRGVSFRQAYPC